MTATVVPSRHLHRADGLAPQDAWHSPATLVGVRVGEPAREDRPQGDQR